MAKDSGLISFDPLGYLLQHGEPAKELAKLAQALNAVRCANLEDRAPDSAEYDPDRRLSLALQHRPESLLDDYMDSRISSELHRILTTGRRLQESVDRVVVIDSGASLLACRAITQACTEPYFNELSRAQRGGRPKLYFTGQDFDNDAARGLLTLLTEGRSAERLEDRWAIIVVNRDLQSMTARTAFCLFCKALGEFYGDNHRAADFLVVLSGEKTPPIVDAIPEMAGESFKLHRDSASPMAAFSTAALMSSAIVGMDVVRLLEGASVMSDRFRTAPPGQNAVLDFAAVGHLFQRQLGGRTRILHIWSQALQSLGLWYNHMATDILQHTGCPFSVTGVNPHVDPAKRGISGQNDHFLVADVTVGQTRCDPWSLESEETAQLVGYPTPAESLPALSSSQIFSTTERTNEAKMPLCRIHLPRINEYTLGQLLQMLMLATVVQGRLAANVEQRDYSQGGVFNGG